MRRRLATLWLAVGGLWALAAGLTLWNHLRIDAIRAGQERLEELRLERVFLTQNARKLRAIVEEHRRLALSAESVALGVLQARRLLEELGSVQGLAEIKVTVGGGEGEPGALSAQIAFRAGADQAMRFILALRDYPFLRVRQVTLTAEPAAGRVAGEMILRLPYRIEPAGEAGTDPRDRAAL